MLNAVRPGARVVALVALAILVVWDQPFIKRMKTSPWIQGPLVAVGVGIALNAGFRTMPPSPASEASHLAQIPVADGLTGFASLLTRPYFSQITSGAVFTSAVTLAVVASLQTLLCVEATETLDPPKRGTPTDRSCWRTCAATPQRCSIARQTPD